LNRLYKYTIVKFSLFLIFVCQAYNSFSQTPYYYRINEENGLPSSEVYQIIQDDFGYIWIGCDAGLYRYDGIRFKSYNSKSQNSKSISGLKIDKDKNLWCQNFSGQIFRLSGDSLQLVIDASKKIVSYSQYAIDHQKRIWIANDKNIELFDFSGESLGSIIKVNQNNDTIIWQEIEANTRGQIFVNSQANGTAYIKENNGKYDVRFIGTTSTLQQRTSFEKYGDDIVALTEINVKREYIISIINEFGEVKKNQFLPFTKDGLVYKIYKDNLSRHWLCTSSGIVQVNKDFQIDSKSKFFLNNDKISSVYQDREGNLWISSLQNGIYVIPSYDLRLYDEQSSQLFDHNITALLKTKKNELLVGTYTGEVYKLNESNSFQKLSQQSEIAYRTVKKMDEYNGGLYVAHGPLSYYENNKEQLLKAYNYRDFCWLDDTLFFVNSSMFSYLPSFHKIPKSEYGRRFIVVHNRGCRAITIDKANKTIYFAAIDGLFKFFDGKVSEVKIDNKTIYANKLFYLDNKLWIGSVNDGLFVLKRDSLVSHYTIGNLLNGRAVKSFKIVDEFVYVATEEGLSKINFLKNTTEFFDYTDGIFSKEINDIEFWNGSVFLATNKGLLKLPNHSLTNLVRPNIEITSIKINQLDMDNTVSDFDLEYNSNNITISFNTSCLKARGSFMYKYRLIGLDSNWIFVAAINNQVQYASLPGGSFTFEVKAVNEDGIESLQSKKIHFLIHAPIWQRWWFYLIMFFIGSGIIVVLFMIRIRFINRRAELRNRVTASQLTALKSQMNPHFLFNILNSLQDLILKHDIKSSNYYLNKFSLMMRKVLDVSGQEEISLTTEIEMLDTYLELEKLRFGDDFIYSVVLEEEIDADNLLLPPMIIQPFIENALKHGLLHKKGLKTLKIEFKLDVDTLLCVITDNGIGRKKSEEIKSRHGRSHQSFATKATEKRIELLNSYGKSEFNFQIIDNIQEDKSIGTTVIISIPYIIS
jgi:ligand-binding sensor domain-containing protein/anti-sigma regulatory factor (Ser/Thr protein kinase)